MKNAHVANAQAVQGRDTYGKLLYTVSPTEAYLVKKEYIPGMSTGEMSHVEQDIAERIDDYIRSNKEFVGVERYERGERVLATHEELKDIHGAPTRIYVTSSPTKSPSKYANYSVISDNDKSTHHRVIHDMELEASRISERLTSKQETHASDQIKRAYENLR
jgi:hypothetical protein